MFKEGVFQQRGGMDNLKAIDFGAVHPHLGIYGLDQGAFLVELTKIGPRAVVGFINNHMDAAEFAEGLGNLVRLFSGNTCAVIARHYMIDHGRCDIAVFPFGKKG